MIKKIFLYSALIYFLLGVTLALGAWHRASLEGIIMLAAIALVVAGLGIFIGMFISVIFRRPSYENGFYVSGQVIVVFVIVGVSFFSLLSIMGDKMPTNKEKNDRTIRDLAGSSPEVWIAYDSFESRFNNPNAFVLKHHVILRDSLFFHPERDSARIVYFFYSVYDNNWKDRYAMFTIIDTVVRVDRFNADRAQSLYDSLQKKFGSQ